MKYIKKFENIQTLQRTKMPKVTKDSGINQAIERFESIYKTLPQEKKREINQYFEK